MNFQITEDMAKHRAEAPHLTTGDLYGRPYAKLAELKPGSMVQIHEGFPFDGQSEIRPWTAVEVKSDGQELYLDSIIQDHDGELRLDGAIRLTDQACCEYWPDESIIDGGDNDALIGVYHAGIQLSLNERFAHDNSVSLFLPPHPREVNRSRVEIEQMIALIDPQATLSVAENGDITIQFSDGSNRTIDEGPDSEGLYCLFYSNIR
jgi:hypothetical protein